MYFIVSSMFLKLLFSEILCLLRHFQSFLARYKLKQLFIGVTLLVKRTSGKKSHPFWAIFTRFRRVDDR